MKLIEELAARRRFGMKAGLEAISALCAMTGNPQRALGTVIHIAGTNGKGAVAAMLDACLGAGGVHAGRYTSPHLCQINERFFLDGKMVLDAQLEAAAAGVIAALSSAEGRRRIPEATFFEALTAVAFRLFADAKVEFSILETGLGGRLDATNIALGDLAVITRIGLDHCSWLGDSVEKIAAEKAGIIKPGAIVVAGVNEFAALEIVERTAQERGAKFIYAPDLADETEIPGGFPLAGAFNRENAVTAIAAIKALILAGKLPGPPERYLGGLGRIVWPGRFQRIGRFIVDGAHNPPAARALARSLAQTLSPASVKLVAIVGFCGDKDVEATLAPLVPFISRAIAVRTANPRSVPAVELACRLAKLGIAAEAADSLGAAMSLARDSRCETVLVFGSLFLAGEALVELGAYPWPANRRDASELLSSSSMPSVSPVSEADLGCGAAGLNIVGLP